MTICSNANNACCVALEYAYFSGEFRSLDVTERTFLCVPVEGGSKHMGGDATQFVRSDVNERDNCMTWWKFQQLRRDNA